jgi:hypothetical protein
VAVLDAAERFLSTGPDLGAARVVR